MPKRELLLHPYKERLLVILRLLLSDRVSLSNASRIVKFKS